MNGVRSIPMRKGYLLTALAAAVLLAASSGTAYAQSIGFSGSSNSMMEGATPDEKTPAPIVVDHQYQRSHSWKATTPIEKTGLGTITIDHNADTAYPGQATRSGDHAAGLDRWREFGSR